MALTAFQILDKAIESDSALGKKALVGSAKEGGKLLDELCQSGCISKTADRSPKYSLTPHGREIWERQAPPERRQHVKEEQQRNQRDSLTDFLSLVEKRSGTALSKSEQIRIPQALRQDALNRKLVEPATKANSYRLLPAGQEMLLSEQPVEQQLQRLRELQSKIVAQLRSIHQRLDEELARLDGDSMQDMRIARTELKDRGEQASQALDSLLAELSAFPRLLSAARRLQAEQRQLTELEVRVRQSLLDQHEQLEAFERRMEQRFHEWSRPTHSEKDPGLLNASVWEATRQAAEKLKLETFRLGGIVKVPELTDAVRKAFPALSPAAFHELLRKWQQEDRLTLQLCNDPRLEPRAAEGIASPRGLLFYVQLR